MKSAPKAKEPKKINKFLVAGHKDSDLSRVKNVLLECNVDDAKNLNKEKITPQEISKILLKAHGLEECEESPVQLNINPLWNGLAMDLMMSNIDSSLWVWEDPDAVTLLEYWKSLDTNLGFILVYTSPEQFIANLVDNISSIETEMLKEEFQKWISYNRALLNFYYRNQDISILVNSGQVIQNSNLYLEQIEQQIGLPKEQLTHELAISSKESNIQPPQSNHMIALIAQRLISADMNSLYAEMQSIANLPLDHSAISKASTLSMLQQYVAEKKESNQIKEEYSSTKKELESIKEENELLLSQFKDVQQKLETIYREKKELDQKLTIKINELHNTQEKNQLLLEQLMIVQEELEKYYIEKKELEINFESQKTDETLKAQEENELLIGQLMNVQEELEKYYLEHQRLKKDGLKKPTNALKHYGAGERIKQQLSYRLGAKMIEKSKTFGGWLSMPFALLAVRSDYRKNRAKKQAQTLPPIHTYGDAHEAKRVKKHLSYKLGNTTIHCMKSPIGIFKLPFALKKAHTEYKKEKR